MLAIETTFILRTSVLAACYTTMLTSMHCRYKYFARQSALASPIQHAYTFKNAGKVSFNSSLVITDTEAERRGHRVLDCRCHIHQHNY